MTDPLYLLDTNIVIYIYKGQHSKLLTNLEARDTSALAVSSITAAEVLLGLKKSGKDQEIAERLLSKLRVLDFSESDAAVYARIPFRRNSFDNLIAAQAIARSLTLITNNEKDFRKISNLRVENWTV